MMKMDELLKAKWVKALRSGKYKQGVGKLKRRYEGQICHCCLGVLCEITQHEFPDMIEVMDNTILTGIKYDDRDIRLHHELESSLRRAFGIDESVMIQLIEMNDDERLNFKEIAEWIEENETL